MNKVAILLFVLCVLVSCENDDNLPVEEELTTDYNELLRGDLSNEFDAPTQLSFVEGKNFITASQGSGDVDYFTFTVPNGAVLFQIILDDYQSTDSAAFIGIVGGSVFSSNAGSTGAEDLLGGTLYGPSNRGNDILSLMGNLNGAEGFTGSLSAGSYAIWLNQTGDTSEASFNFVLTKI